MLSPSPYTKSTPIEWRTLKEPHTALLMVALPHSTRKMQAKKSVLAQYSMTPTARDCLYMERRIHQWRRKARQRTKTRDYLAGLGRRPLPPLRFAGFLGAFVGAFLGAFFGVFFGATFIFLLFWLED
jgi:hypothetical protein